MFQLYVYMSSNNVLTQTHWGIRAYVNHIINWYNWCYLCWTCCLYTFIKLLMVHQFRNNQVLRAILDVQQIKGKSIWASSHTRAVLHKLFHISVLVSPLFFCCLLWRKLTFFFHVLWEFLNLIYLYHENMTKSTIVTKQTSSQSPLLCLLVHLWHTVTLDHGDAIYNPCSKNLTLHSTFPFSPQSNFMNPMKWKLYMKILATLNEI